MSFLFDDSSPSFNPPDTEALRLGAQRIRELKDRLQTVIGTLLNNDLTVKTSWTLSGAQILPATIPAGSFAAQAVHAADIQNSVFSDGLKKTLNGDPVTVNVDGVTIGFDSSSPKKLQVISGGISAVRNLLVKNNSGAAASKVDVSADEAVLKNNSGRPLTVNNASVTLDISLGVALNGLETGGTELASRWYYIWLISDGANLRGVFEDAGAGAGTAPTGPDLTNAVFSGYTYKLLVGAVRNDGSSNFISFYQTDRQVAFVETAVLAGAAGTAAYTALSGAALTTFQGLVPPNARRAFGNCGSSGTVGNIGGISLSADASGTGACVVIGVIGNDSVDNFKVGGNWQLPLVTAQSFYYKMSDTSAIYRVTCAGFTY